MPVSSTRTSRLPRVTALVAAAAIAVTLLPAHAAAAPHQRKPTIASVRAELDTLARRSERLAESYNKARMQVASAQRAADRARRRAASAQSNYRAARRKLSAMAVAQYEAGSFSTTGALLTSNGTQNYLDRLDTLDLVSQQQGAVTTHMKHTRGDAAAANSAARDLLTAARSRRDAVAARRTAVTKETAKFKALLSSLTAAQRRAYAARQSATPTQDATVTSVHAGNAAAQRAIDFALAQVGKPYVFGAAGPGSYDCSGLTMAAWARGDVSLPHLASAQFNYGTHVTADQLQPGDLVFLYQPIGHVSMYIGHGMLVSAPQPGENVQVVPFSYFRSDFVGGTRLT